MSLAARLAPLAHDIFKGFEVIVRHRDRGGPSRSNSRMYARMNPLVIDNQIVALRQRRKDRDIRGITAAEIQHPLRTEECSRLLFQPLMFGMVAAKKPGSASAHRHAPFESGDHTGAQSS